MSTDTTANLPAYSSDGEKAPAVDKKGAASTGLEDLEGRVSVSSSHVDHTHRKLKARHIQLIGIGGTIGTVLYVRESNKIPWPPPSPISYFCCPRFFSSD